MSAKKERGTWIQCANCGKIYHIEQEVSIDRTYVPAYCPRCEHEVGLNLGDNKDDLYLYMDVNVDQRYYEY